MSNEVIGAGLLLTAWGVTKIVLAWVIVLAAVAYLVREFQK